MLYSRNFSLRLVMFLCFGFQNENLSLDNSIDYTWLISLRYLSQGLHSRESLVY